MTLKVSTVALHNRLICALCKGYFRDAHTIGECLHTFCKTCITKFFVLDRLHHCPTCNIDLKANPSTTLRPDVVVQGIVDLVLPELAREDALEEYNFLTKHGLPVPSLVLDRAGLANEATASTKQIANGNNNGGGGGGDAAQSSSAAARPVYQDNVTFYLMPATMGVSEPLPPLDKNVLRTTAAVTVQALQKFVIKKLKLTVASKDVLLLYRETVLGREQTMRWVLRTVAFEDPIPTIFYKINTGAQQ